MICHSNGLECWRCAYLCGGTRCPLRALLSLSLAQREDYTGETEAKGTQTTSSWKLYHFLLCIQWHPDRSQGSGEGVGEALKEPAVVEGDLDWIRTEFPRVHLDWSQRYFLPLVWSVGEDLILKANVPMGFKNEKDFFPMWMPLSLESSLHILPGYEQQYKEEKGTNT